MARLISNTCLLALPTIEQKPLYEDWFAKALTLAGSGAQAAQKLNLFAPSFVRTTSDDSVLMTRIDGLFWVNFDRIADQDIHALVCAEMILHECNHLMHAPASSFAQDTEINDPQPS